MPRRPGPNKETLKKYPKLRLVPKETIVWVEPSNQSKPVSLFTETVARADRAEKALDPALAEIAMLKAQVKQLSEQLATERRARTGEINAQPYPSMAARRAWNGPPQVANNALSADDVEEMFKAKSYYDEQDARVAKASMPSRLFAPIAALFKR